MLRPSSETIAAVARGLPVGKRLPTAIYIAKDELERIGGLALEITQAAVEIARVSWSSFQVVKWHLDAAKLSLLAYPSFLIDPHPALVTSTSVDFARAEARITDYSESEDPPILHRCEEFISPAHDLYAEIAQLTRHEERLGLFTSTAYIGLRTRWGSLLASKGIAIEGRRIVFSAEAGVPTRPVLDWESERQRSAIRRPQLSLPPKLLLERGILKSGDRYFDYGCGHGLDLPLLHGLGIQAHGWDPAHRPGSSKVPAEIVHVGYVLNVVEDASERAAIVQDAWAHSERVLSIAVRIRHAEDPPTGKPYRDGEVTKSGTFQRYFEPDELAPWLEGLLNHPVLALAPGIVIVARDESTIQQAISSRRRWKPEPADLLAIDEPVESAASTDEDVSEPAPTPALKAERIGPRQRQIRVLLAEASPELATFGRCPREEEWTRPAAAEPLRLSTAQIWNLYARSMGQAAIERQAHARRAEVLLYLAMSHFRKVPSLAELPVRVRNDLATLFDGHRSAVALAKACLVQAGDPAVIAKLCDATTVGVCDDQALYVHVTAVPKLHPVLRCYLGCAEMLGAPLETADLVKLHKRSRKVTLLIYQEFSTAPLPALVERIKVDLRSRKVMVFDHRPQPRQLLFDKDLYLPEDDPRKTEWEQRSDALGKLIGPVRGRGPHHLDLRVAIEKCGGDPNDWAPLDYASPLADDHDEVTSDDTAQPPLGTDGASEPVASAG